MKKQEVDMRAQSLKSRRPSPTRESRLDGKAHWRKTLDRYLWILAKAGVRRSDISKFVKTSLKRHRLARSVDVPSARVIQVARVLDLWENDPRFVDPTSALPRTLKLEGGEASFQSLARESLPNVDPKEVLQLLLEHRTIARSRRGMVRMLDAAFVPLGADRGPLMMITLSSIEAFVDTCFVNMRTSDPTLRRGLLQRVVFCDNFDPAKLAAYDDFLRATAKAFLAMQDRFLKKCEMRDDVKSPAANGRGRRRRRTVWAGVSLSGFRTF
jgi:hypothetical protein